jgi:SAM-dependent methyltransferase
MHGRLVARTTNSGRDYYANIFSTQLDDEAKFLAIGAIEKVNSIEQLLAEQGVRAESVLELGAGSGAIIAELQRRSFARRYIALDYSSAACQYMQEHLSEVDIRCADIVHEPVRDNVDVVVLSHVLEHLEQPETMLRRLVENVGFDWAVIECPLEDLIASRVKNLFRDRYRNIAGHVQFFTAASLRALVGRHLDIVRFRHYAPWTPPEAVAFIGRKDRLPEPARLVKYLTMHLLPKTLGPLWKHVWLGNYAMLCRKKHPTSP